ncbi:MAG: hypothetical protein F6K02_15890 [Moorea sp. SIO3A5]|nr:hypothetical protein [Moorena sp. SIO3A5]
MTKVSNLSKRKSLGVADSGYGFAPLAPQFCGATRGEFNSPTESAPVGE